MTQRLATGIDMIEIHRFTTIAPGIRDRFIRRVFSPAEQAECANIDERLAGKFAAKEAVAKALGSGVGQVGWQDIEITNDPSGQPQVSLKRTAAQIADSLHLTVWSISITHTHDIAAAVAVAISTE